MTEWEDFDEEDDVIDLRANDVLGGVYMFNLLEMPPQPKTVESCWIITKCILHICCFNLLKDERTEIGAGNSYQTFNFILVLAIVFKYSFFYHIGL